jgi:dGTPase
VASVAGTIAGALRLNTDLVAAIALGHDLGHAPFGHRGEKCLSELAKRHGLGQFCHELHSLRVVDVLESPYRGRGGLDLTFAVRDGIVCHYGEGFEQSLRPNRTKTPKALKSLRRRATRPATLEGCVVRVADKVAYLGRDLEDAVEVGLIKRDELPRSVSKVLGRTNRDIIARLVDDIVAHSSGQDCIALSRPMHAALNVFYKFSRKRIYESETVTRKFRQVRKAMEFVFGEFLDLAHSAKKSRDDDLFPGRSEWCVSVFEDFLKSDVRKWRNEKPARLVLDFIAGMTDSFFIEAVEELHLPKSSV